jgi:hypothetical protein
MKKLTAGPLTLDYSEGSLWNISDGSEEVIRRIYLVFQDINWTSRPFTIKKEEWQINEKSFTAKLQMQGTQDAKDFSVELFITGSEGGEITYGFIGSTTKPFLRNRLGLCLLHPVANLAGRSCELLRPDGSIEKSIFPKNISPDQPFLNLAGISHQLSSGKTALVKFEGEVFETEDHRNWSDASYKTYCTPISLPFPAEVQAGAQIKQSIKVSLNGGAAKSSESDQVLGNLISVSNKPIPLPEIGLGLNSIAEHLELSEYSGFEELGIRHLRLSLNVSSASKSDVAKALDITKKLGIKLDISLTAENPDQVSDFLGSLGELNEEINQLFLFSSKDKTTPADFINAAREVSSNDYEIAGGTDLYFTELNRDPHCTEFADQINFSINPQVHSFDDRTLIQNTATQKTIVLNASKIAAGKSINVGPITLRPRYNPNATQPEKDVSNTPLPSSVDARQRTWFTEGWTAMSLRSIAESSAVSKVTYFETLGWRGIKEFSTGSKDPINFPSIPGEKFPVWNLIAALKGFTHILPTESSSPETVDSLILRLESSLKVILVNFSTIEQEVEFRGVDLAPQMLSPESVTYLEIKGAKYV